VDRLKFYFVAEVVGETLYAKNACVSFLHGYSKFNACEKTGLFALEKIAPVEQSVSKWNVIS